MIRENIRKRINHAVKHLYSIEVPDFTIEVPTDEEHGHYAANVAFACVKSVKKSPLEIATQIANALYEKQGKSHKFIERIEVAAPGFVNMWISIETLREEVRALCSKKEAYITESLKQGNVEHVKKVQIEYISANPTGPLTVANGRGGFWGHALANVLERAGQPLEREYYVNDTGNQVNVLGLSILATLGLVPDEDRFYKGAYVKEWAEENGRAAKKFIKDAHGLGRLAATEFMDAAKLVMEKKAGIAFDRYTSEYADIHRKGLVERALARLKESGKTYEAEGALWLKTTDFGDDKDRVLMTRDKYPTYFLADAGHYLETIERGFTRKINILGPDHYGYIARIQAAAKLIGLPDSEVIITQMVRLVRDGEEVKMSKRKGEFVTFEELIDEVGADAARFLFLVASLDSHMDFDMGLAKERSMKNPVFYAQYAYVRAANIVRKTRFLFASVAWESLGTPEDENLMLILLRYPEVIVDTAEDYQVNRVTRYVLELSKAFHNFYEKERVVGEIRSVAAARRKLVIATQVVLGDALKLLGVSLPKKM